MKYHTKITYKGDRLRIPCETTKLHLIRVRPSDFNHAWNIQCEYETTKGILWWKHKVVLMCTIECFYPAFDSWSSDNWSDHIGFKTRSEAEYVIKRLNELYVCKEITK